MKETAYGPVNKLLCAAGAAVIVGMIFVSALYAGDLPKASAKSYGFSFENPRLNSRSLETASGDVVMLAGDLKEGAFVVTGRLSTMDKADKLLFSEDNGVTWHEIEKDQNILYSFVPLPDKLYQPLLKIKTTDLQQVELKVFPRVTGIIFRNIDIEQMVAETVKKISDAYEAQNFGAFSECISRDFLGNRVLLEEGVRFDFDMFTGIKLVIYIDRIEKRQNEFVADAKWDKTQMPRKTGQQQNTSGRTTMVFALEDGMMKLKNLRGNLIYATLSPEIAQSSGLNASVINSIITAHDARNPVQPGAGETEVSGGVSAVVAGTLTMTSPNGTETLAASATNHLTWTFTGNLKNVKLEYSALSTAGPWTTIVSSTPAGPGTYDWSTPALSGASFRIRITSVENPSITDMSDGDFSIL